MSTGENVVMEGERERRGCRPQFTIRTMLFVTLLIALGMGWYSSMERAREKLRREGEERRKLYRLMKDATNQYNLSLWRNKARERAESKQREVAGVNLKDAKIEVGEFAFAETSFIDCSFRNAILRIDGGAFQGSQLDNTDLADVELTASGSTFQSASFVSADLSGAVITCSGASFQGASFANADLSGAVLTTGGTSFQGVSLDGAKLTAARLEFDVVSFQGANINGAQFQGADLSTADWRTLEGWCYFETPPSYDEETRFPAGFDPVERGWTRVMARDD